jgi:hypothetical protein
MAHRIALNQIEYNPGEDHIGGMNCPRKRKVICRGTSQTDVSRGEGQQADKK